MATGTLKAVLSKDKFYSSAAKAYSDSYLWKNGDFCSYGDKIYKFIGEDLIAGENWNPAHWAETKIADELENLADQIAALDPEANVGIFTDVNFIIATTSWTAGTNVWTYNFSNALIKETAGVVAYYDDSFRTALAGDIKLEKYTGYVTFTTNKEPTGTLSGTLRIIDSVAGVLPVARGGTGASTNKAARQNLNVSIRPIPCSFGTVSSLPQTIYDPDITADMVPSKWLFGTPAACPNGLTCTTALGSVTISLPTGGSFSGETTVYLELVNPRSSTDGASGQQSESYAGDFVQIGAQTLTTSQKTQARTNIDAANAAVLGSPSSASAVTGDDAFSKIATLNSNLTSVNNKIENETYDAIKIDSTTIGYVMKVGRLCIALLTVKNATIPTTGVALPAKYKADSDYRSMCRYYDGSSDKVGTLYIPYNSTTLYLYDLADQATSGRYVGGTLAYFTWNTDL